jgi:hypothetical protein
MPEQLQKLRGAFLAKKYTEIKGKHNGKIRGTNRTDTD